MRSKCTSDGRFTRDDELECGFPGSGVRASLRPVARWRDLFAVSLLVIVAQILSIGTVAAKGEPFEIRSAVTRLSNGVYFATARIDYRLSDDALEALESGIALTIQLQIEVARVRRFWVDQKVASLKQDYQLSYQPLSERYVVKNLNSGEQGSYATLFSALNTMGRVVDLPIIDAALLEPNTPHEISIRAVLDQNTLPGPLRLIAFWSSGFRLQSDWYTWKLSG